MGELYEKVVKRLIEYRKELNITQGEMGEILGVTQGHFSKWSMKK
ncbi:helix-turn-helix domain-containing protein [Gallintestinimicrobium propionicum]|uniref:Helix-turn-helix transcriptional regulator n=1 Tax=Gallintestinimicrobium propionicum TaxID=2981770 RepID=A0AAE3AW00_9FIRM|nr:helix-turn-helix transcriptional regulator [Gallintestinimicrobium propionicum]MCC2168801.1 helix-turn-helix transcriptional regulator [Gallintestinimicrobium propionicum]